MPPLSLKEFAKKVPALVATRRYIFRHIILRYSRESFLSGLPDNSKILDVGCGNTAPFYTKSILPNCTYTGLDVDGYYNDLEFWDRNREKPITADEYIVTTSGGFASEIERFQNEFDAVVSVHNLEHCEDRDRVLLAMLRAVKPGGMLYICFPCEQSVDFPNRTGTLNYYDDNTHKGTPPEYSKTLNMIRTERFKILYSVKNYKPLLYWICGLAMESKSKRENRVYYSTWAYYGFESIMCARKVS